MNDSLLYWFGQVGFVASCDRVQSSREKNLCHILNFGKKTSIKMCKTIDQKRRFTMYLQQLLMFILKIVLFFCPSWTYTSLGLQCLLSET